MNIEVKSISPVIAKRMLEGNIHNRPLNQRHVEFLSREMSTGSWKFNGESIKLNGDKLIDGQHRLQACVQSGHPFKTIVVSGLDSETFDTIDCGRNRNGSDTLALLGEKNTNVLASAVSFLINMDKGYINRHRSRIPNSAIKSKLEHNPEIRRSVRLVSSSNKSCLMSASVLAALHFLFSKADTELADAFVSGVINGDGLDDDSPVFKLREKLIASKMRRLKFPRDYWPAMAIKAWNLFFMGKTVKYLRYLDTEKFPKIAGLK